MIHTLVIDVYDEEVMKILRNMELQKKIKLHNDLRIDDNIKWSDQFKGSMSPQDIKTIDAQLNDLRNGWE
jgi:hypothetical protein